MKISIVTVTYNCVEVVLDCLMSVAKQSYVDIEHVVIDGASTDGTLALLKAHQEKLAVCISKPDCGIYDAMNKGIAHTSGDVIGFLNADDFYSHDQVLSSVAKYFNADPSLDACYADLVYVKPSDTLRIVRYWKSNLFVRGSFRKGWCPPHPTFFVRRSVYENFGVFDLSYRIAADVELMMRFLEKYAIRVIYIPDVWVKMRLGGTTNKNLRNIWVQNKEILRALKSHAQTVNPIIFFVSKFLLRSKQFVQRPLG